MQEVNSSMTKFIPHSYQQYAIDTLTDNPITGLFLDMGLRQNGHNFNSNPGNKE